MGGFWRITTEPQLLPIYNFEKSVLLQDTVQEEQTDVNDTEYNKILDNATKSQRSSKEKIIEAAKRLESI